MRANQEKHRRPKLLSLKGRNNQFMTMHLRFLITKKVKWWSKRVSFLQVQWVWSQALWHQRGWSWLHGPSAETVAAMCIPSSRGCWDTLGKSERDQNRGLHRYNTLDKSNASSLFCLFLTLGYWYSVVFDFRTYEQGLWDTFEQLSQHNNPL